MRAHLIFAVILLTIGAVIGAPKIGVYVGGAAKAPPGIAEFSSWLGRDVNYGLEVLLATSWNDIPSYNWQLSPWRDWVSEAPDRTMVLSIPMTVNGVSMADAIAANVSSYFAKLGENLVKYNLTNTHLRIGWEFNAGWFAWNTSQVGCTKWTQYFRTIVDAIKSAPGQNFSVVWCPNLGGTVHPIEDCYPGNDYVDYVGLDTYDGGFWPFGMSYPDWRSNFTYHVNEAVEVDRTVYKCLMEHKDVYPGTNSSVWSLFVNSTQLYTARVNSWKNLYNTQYGLAFWPEFARAHSKPFCLNEWGTWDRQYGGFDNDYYIERMHEYIFNASNNVAYYSYYDINASDGGHRLRPPTHFPHASAKFLELFSVDPQAPDTSSNTVPGVANEPHRNATPQSGNNSVTSFAIHLSSIPTMFVFIFLLS